MIVKALECAGDTYVPPPAATSITEPAARAAVDRTPRGSATAVVVGEGAVLAARGEVFPADVSAAARIAEVSPVGAMA